MKQNNIKQKIAEYFLRNPTVRLRVRQIERELKLSLPSVIRYVKELVKDGLLKENKISEVMFYTADRSNKNFRLEKVIYNLRSLYHCGLVEFLITEYSNPSILLFGSYSKGEDIETSDVDIYVETSSKKKVNLQKFEKTLERKIQLFIYPHIKDVPNPQLANNILNGISLNGQVEVIK